MRIFKPSCVPVRLTRSLVLTAAFGLVMRAMGNGMRVGVIQFVKGKWDTGERAILEHFPDQIEIQAMGEGFSWNTQDKARDIAAARKAWEKSKEMIEASRHGTVLYRTGEVDSLSVPAPAQAQPGAEPGFQQVFTGIEQTGIEKVGA